MAEPLLPDLSDPSAWLPVASGDATLVLSRDGEALKLEFDFHGGGGFVVARRLLDLRLPETFTLSFRLRGVTAGNSLELKFEDPSHKNVWRYGPVELDVESDAWREIVLQRRDFPFAWGPMGGAVEEVGAIEFAVVAKSGGRGALWLADLELEDQTPRQPPIATASSTAPAANVAAPLDKGQGVWEPAADDGDPWWQVDFRGLRQPGGVALHWGMCGEGGSFDVETSVDGIEWSAVGGGLSSTTVNHIRLRGDDIRGLRLRFRGQTQRRVRLRRVMLMPVEAGASLSSFLHEVAGDLPRGWMPRYWLREQSYWTSTGTPAGGPCPIMNQEGMVEPFPKGFSLEPFVVQDGRLLTWADVETQVALAENRLPLPEVMWRAGGVELRISAAVVNEGGCRVLHLRYQVSVPPGAEVGLCVCVRPFQVSPTWQAYRDLGGAACVREVSIQANEMCINGSARLCWNRAPTRAGAMTFAEGPIAAVLASGGVPAAQAVSDAQELASAALIWDLAAAATGAHQIDLRIPLDRARTAGAECSAGECDPFEQAAAEWRAATGGWDISVPVEAAPMIDAWRTAAAHILVHRDGPALQPGPRRYARCWIRDATTMAAALLRCGRSREAGELLSWYARFQREDGFIPCCVDAEGPDWLVEHDSHGQFLHALYDYVSFTGDMDLPRNLWPAARKAVLFLHRLISNGSGGAGDLSGGDRRASLLPESASHEGYLAHPVHAFWDDFWALRGLNDARTLAGFMGDEEIQRLLPPLCADFEQAIASALAATVADHHLDHVPGSVEWADFDPTATSVAVSLLHRLPGVPGPLIDATFDRYLAGFRERRAGRIDWSNYTAYEVRIVGALARLGRRTDALDLLNFLFADRRPAAWNQWPEISWHDPASPGHLGDVPHTWIGAEYVLAARGLFAYERASDHALVLAAGLPLAWLTAQGVSVADLPTPWGPLSYHLRMTAPNQWHLALGAGLVIPPGGIVVEAPTGGGIIEVRIDGAAAPHRAGRELVLRHSPAEIGVTWARIEEGSPMV